MARQATGTVEHRNGKWYGRVTAANSKRVRVVLGDWPKSPQGEARAREAAAAWTEKLRERGLGAVARGERGSSTGDGCEAWLHAWLAHRDGKGMTSTPENRSHYFQHIAPAIGTKHVRDWTGEDLRKLCRALDAKVQAGALSWKSATNIWGTATKMCKDAATSKIEALRVRTDNPAPGVAGPDRGARTVKQYLWPSEFLRFVTCTEVPLEWRRVVALAVYLFPRASELRVLRWDDVDLEHGTVHIHRSRDRNTGAEKGTKTDEARRFAVEAGALPLLRVLRQETGGHGFVVELPSERDMARGLRRWLAKAGVDRAELHTTSRTRKAMTFHDLRATGLTWMAVRGDDPLKIMQRAGHRDFKTTQDYIREAEAVRQGFGDVFPALPQSLLGAGATRPVAGSPGSSGGRAGGRRGGAAMDQPGAFAGLDAGAHVGGAEHPEDRDLGGDSIAHRIAHAAHEPTLRRTRRVGRRPRVVQDRAGLCAFVSPDPGSSPVRPANQSAAMSPRAESVAGFATSASSPSCCPPALVMAECATELDLLALDELDAELGHLLAQQRPWQRRVEVDDVASGPVGVTAGGTTKRKWRTAVVRLSDRVSVRSRPATPRHDARCGEPAWAASAARWPSIQFKRLVGRIRARTRRPCPHGSSAVAGEIRIGTRYHARYRYPYCGSLEDAPTRMKTVLDANLAAGLAERFSA